MAEHLVVTQKPAGGKGLVLADLNQFAVNIVIPNVPCDIDIFDGAAVIMRANGVAKLALADSLANSNVIGIVDSKPTTSTCNIRVANVTLDVFAGLDVTKEYYLSDVLPGRLSTAIPTTSGHIRLKIGQPFNDKQMLIMKGDRMVRS